MGERDNIMGTPAFIGIQRVQNGPIQGISCHHGHILPLGILLLNYDSIDDVQDLIDLGNLSSVHETNEKTVAHSRDFNRTFSSCRGKMFAHISELRERTQSQYYFFFIFRDDEWHVSVDGYWYHPLHSALEQMGVELPQKEIQEETAQPVNTVCNCGRCNHIRNNS